MMGQCLAKSTGTPTLATTPPWWRCRNPWVARQAYNLTLDECLGFTAGSEGFSIISLYPEPRVYGERFKYGDVCQIPLAPYETIVLQINCSQESHGLPSVGSAIGTQLAVDRADCRLQRFSFQDTGETLGPNWTSLLGTATSAVQVTLDAEVTLAAPCGDLLILCEGAKSLAQSVGQLNVNGTRVQAESIVSDAGWSATLLPRHEHWTFSRVPLQEGKNQITGQLYAASDCSTISVWVWARKPGADFVGSDRLPSPETVSVDGVVLLAPTSVDSLPAATKRMSRPKERIDGIYLDALQPVFVSQGWGQLQKNQSVWEKPMMIAGKRYFRGLGTHAPARIVYRLDGKYHRFQSWVGADGNTNPTVTCEVWIDGAKKWESGLITRTTPAQWIDLDVTGAQKLELVVGDAGNLMADHTDWADAQPALLTRSQRKHFGR